MRGNSVSQQDQKNRRSGHQSYDFTDEIESSKSLKPLKIGNIPRMAVALGMITPRNYDVYQKCDGNQEVQALAETMKIPLNDFVKIIHQLLKSRLIKA